jgi:hypothetical protein
MQEKQILAEKNPFLRDYFASQAELFHSQKVAKKLLLEGNKNDERFFLLFNDIVYKPL